MLKSLKKKYRKAPQEEEGAGGGEGAAANGGKAEEGKGMNAKALTPGIAEYKQLYLIKWYIMMRYYYIIELLRVSTAHRIVLIKWDHAWSVLASGSDKYVI